MSTFAPKPNLDLSYTVLELLSSWTQQPSFSPSQRLDHSHSGTSPLTPPSFCHWSLLSAHLLHLLRRRSRLIALKPFHKSPLRGRLIRARWQTYLSLCPWFATGQENRWLYWSRNGKHTFLFLFYLGSPGGQVLARVTLSCLDSLTACFLFVSLFL